MIDVAKLRALLAAATPGPWTEDDGSLYGPNDGAVAHIARHASMHTVLATGEDWKHADAALIAAAVNALPGLLDQLEALRAERDRMSTQAAERERHLSWHRSTCASLNDQVVAWRTATGCDSPGEAQAEIAYLRETAALFAGRAAGLPDPPTARKPPGEQEGT